IVRLEGALALAHGRLSRSAARIGAGRRSALVLDGWCGGDALSRCAAVAIALVRGDARRTLVGSRPPADTVDLRVRSAARGGQTAPGTTIRRCRRLQSVTADTRSSHARILRASGGLWLATPVG